MARKSKGEEIEEQVTRRLEEHAARKAQEEEQQDKLSSEEDPAQETQVIDMRAVQEQAEAQRAELVEDATHAIDALHEDDEDERITQLLTPIGNGMPTVTPVVQGPTESVQTTFRRNEGRVRHKVAAALISILVVFSIGLGFGMYSKHMQQKAEAAAQQAENERLAAEAQAQREREEAEAEAQRELEAARAPRQLKFIVSAADLDEQSTRIPLVISGTDAEGNEVHTEGFINYEGEGLSLSPGDYSATIPASPVRADGGLYKTPEDTYNFRVPNDDQERIQVDQAMVLIPLNVAELTNDIINNAYNWAQKDTQNSSIVEANVAAARRVKEEEEARKRAEEARKKRDEERAPLAQRFVENYFTNLSFPKEDDDSKISRVTNWNAVVGQYVASGSKAQDKIGNGPVATYVFATRVNASSMSDSSVVVDVQYVASSDAKSGWTKKTSKASVTVTFDDENKITDFTVN